MTTGSRVFLLFCYFFFFALSGKAQSHLKKIKNYSDFKTLSGAPLSDKYGMVEAIKIVLDLRDSAIYYCSSKEYKYHVDFCRKKLKFRGDIKSFNDANYYLSKNRRFLLANINYFNKIGVFVLEISALDLMPKNQIELLYKKVTQSFYEKDSVKFLLHNSRLINEDLNIRTIHPSNIYKNQTFQAISNGQNKGLLRFIDHIEEATFSERDIIILKDTPLFLPKVAGIIVSEFQTPLSHLSILGQNRDIPIAAIKNVFENENLKELSNKWVNYNVTKANYTISEADSIQQFKPRRGSIKVYSNLKVNHLVDFDELKRKSYRYIGNKAHNFGILKELSKNRNFKVPESAFAIPFFFYHQHLQQSNTDILINRLIATEQTLSEDSLKKYLKRIRKSIKEHPVDTNLLIRVESKIQSLGNHTRMRFRSSTNAEDAKGFSGAGLYQSKTGDISNSNKPIDKAIKKVWASLWSYNAYKERSFFKITHNKVYMGVLVHRSFPNEAVNGVCISKNVYRKEYSGFIVNAQLGDESVVKPKKDQITDQFICFPDSTREVYNKQTDIEIITTSNLNNNQLTMSLEEIKNLANQIEFIKRYMFLHTTKTGDYLDFGLDFEFKINGKYRDLYIKQMRPFND